MWSVNKRNKEVIKLVSKSMKEKSIGRYNSAIQYLNDAINIDDKDLEVYFLRGKLNFIIGKYDLSIEDYNKSILIYLNQTKDIENEELVINALIQYSLHLGNSIIAKEAYNNNDLTTIEFLKEYRKSIDSFYKKNSISLEHIKKGFEKYKIECLIKGLDYLEELKDDKLNYFTNLAKEKIYTKNDIKTSKITS